MKKKLLIWMLAGCMAAAMPATVLAAENVEESGTETEAGTAELGDDIYSFQVMFDGDLLKLPMSCDELISMGWQAENPEDLDTMVQTNSYITGVRFVKGNYYISADILNLGINEEPASKCLIGGIEVDASGAVHENIGQKIEPRHRNASGKY